MEERERLGFPFLRENSEDLPYDPSMRFLFPFVFLQNLNLSSSFLPVPRDGAAKWSLLVNGRCF